MARRSRAREFALQVLYQDDLNPSDDSSEAQTYLRRRLKALDLLEFSLSLVKGVQQHREQLDAALDEACDNWTLKRMAATDRNVLRIGAFEILYTETPERVALDEAVELAKRFGTRQSSQFVNGILDQVLAQKTGQGGGPSATGSET